MKLAKLVPFIVVAAAMIGIYFQYQTYKTLTAKKCNCNGEEYSPIEE